MQLSESEKRDIVEHLESGKPLPEQYRFLLFDDKREVELVWNGKTNEVTNVVLPFQVIEQVDEPRVEKPRMDANTRESEDFLVKLSATRIVIVETKGQEDLDVPLKMERLRQWCEDINRVQAAMEYDFVDVDEESFEKYKPTSFRQLVDGFREYKGKI